MLHNARKSLVISLIVIFVVALSSFSSSAGSVSFSGTLTTSSSPVTVSWCSGFSEYMDVVPFTVSTTGVYSFTGLTATSNFFAQVNFTADNSYTPHINEDTYGSSPVAASPSNTLTAGTTYYFVGVSACSSFPLSYSVTLSGPGDILVAGASAPTETSVSDVVMPPDNRINWQFGDLSAVIFDHEDGVVVYCYVDGATWLGMHINQELVDNADANQAQEIPVLEYNENGCHVAFYVLDSGEYQINIWTHDNKFYEIIADNLDFANATMRSTEFGN
jgi:hypothetical protein